jgi:chromosome segregation ATPase
MAVPYYMREELEPGRDRLEIIAAVVGLVLLVTCAISNVPYVHQTTPAARAAKLREQDRQVLAQLQTATRQLQTRSDAADLQLTKVSRLLESTRSELAKLTEGYGPLSAQVTTTSSKLQQLDASVRVASERLAKFSESGAVQKLSQERDQALSHSQEKEDQVRQLTLKLQKAGIYP